VKFASIAWLRTPKAMVPSLHRIGGDVARLDLTAAERVGAAAEGHKERDHGRAYPAGGAASQRPAASRASVRLVKSCCEIDNPRRIL
jgi:hypothetical protein